MIFAVGDVVTAVQRSGTWRVAEIVGGPEGPIYRLQRDTWRNPEGAEAGEAELAPAEVGAPRTYEVGTALVMFGRSAKIVSVHDGDRYTVEVEPPKHEPRRGVDDVQRTHVYFALPRWRLERSF